MIKKGDQITIRPEWQDTDDDQFDWFAAEDSHDERGPMPTLRAIAIHKDPAQRIDWFIQPVYTFRAEHIFETL